MGRPTHPPSQGTRCGGHHCAPAAALAPLQLYQQRGAASMSGMEGTDSADVGGGARNMEANVAYDIDRSEHIENTEQAGRALDGTQASETGYRDVPLTEFREQHEGEFVEPYARSYPVEKFGDPDHLVSTINPDFGDPSGRYNVNCAD